MVLVENVQFNIDFDDENFTLSHGHGHGNQCVRNDRKTVYRFCFLF